MSDVVQVQILVDSRRMPPDLLEILEKAVCPDPEEPGHEERCPLVMMSIGPMRE